MNRPPTTKKRKRRYARNRANNMHGARPMWEVAQMLGISTPTLLRLEHSALAKMRAAIESDEELQSLLFDVMQNGLPEGGPAWPDVS